MKFSSLDIAGIAIAVVIMPVMPAFAQTQGSYEDFKNQWNSMMAAVSDGALKRQDCDLIYQQVDLVNSNQWLAELSQGHPSRRKYLVAKENANSNAARCRKIGYAPSSLTAAMGAGVFKGDNRTVIQGSQNVVNAMQVTHVHHHHYTTNNSEVNVNQPHRY